MLKKKKRKKDVCELEMSVEFCPEGRNCILFFFPKQEYSIQHNTLLAIHFLWFYIAVATLAVFVY